MQNDLNRERATGPSRRKWILLAVSLTLLVACSDDSLIDLGGRSSDWIGEVATTAATTTTTAPVVTHTALDAVWFNDEFGAPETDMEQDRVLASVFARAGDSSQFLQASREEIATVVPDVRFPSTLPVQVEYVTSQLVIESRELVLADDPTVAFGLWSVEPYTRSRSVGQMGVLTVARDQVGLELAETGDDEGLCAYLVSGERVCAPEDIDAGTVYRLEDAGGVVHVWYADPFRYRLEGMNAFDENLVHTMISSMAPLTEMLPS